MCENYLKHVKMCHQSISINQPVDMTLSQIFSGNKESSIQAKTLYCVIVLILIFHLHIPMFTRCISVLSMTKSFMIIYPIATLHTWPAVGCLIKFCMVDA